MLFRSAIKLSGGSIAPFFTRPISLALFLITVAFVLYSVISDVRRKKTAGTAQKETGEDIL